MAKDIECPRDHSLMKEVRLADAFLDVCEKCGGQFFDSGEMFAACGIKADPSYWDRPETGGSVRDGGAGCPRCHHPMLIQDVNYESHKVQIDRCGKCGGIFLDKGEIEQIMQIGDKMVPVIEAEKKKAQEELDKMDPSAFAAPGLIARFLGMFKKK
jgi:Zn-finger nucleic acid-binding protein